MTTDKALVIHLPLKFITDKLTNYGHIDEIRGDQLA